MEQVEWESNGVTYTAKKLLSNEEYAMVDIAVAGLVRRDLRPTKIIGGQHQIKQLKEVFSHRISLGGELCFDYEGVDLVPIVVDHRVKANVYVVYEDMDLTELEAPEFAGLDELP